MWQMRYVYYVSWSQSLYICGKCAMSTMSHGPSLYTYVANALCLLCLIVPVSISVTYVDIHCKYTVSTMSHCPSLYLCLSMWVYICVYINCKSTMSTIFTMPHKSLRGMQRVSNPSTENQRISTPVHSNRWKSERTLVRSQWYKSNKTGYMRSKTHIQEAFCAVYSVYYVYFVYYEVATIGRLVKMIGFCCKRAL